jgi:hypothetical protein
VEIGFGVVVGDLDVIPVGADSEISLAEVVHPASKTISKRILMLVRQTWVGSRMGFVPILALRK